MRLGQNINHIATLREGSKIYDPNLKEAIKDMLDLMRV